MTTEIMTCLAILAAAVVLFSWDRIPADVVALGVLLAVIVTGLVPAEKALAGFGSGTVIMILGFFIMTAALSHTGIVDTRRASGSCCARETARSCSSQW